MRPAEGIEQLAMEDILLASLNILMDHFTTIYDQIYLPKRISAPSYSSRATLNACSVMDVAERFGIDQKRRRNLVCGSFGGMYL
jgi:hypothetical protein